MANNNVLNRIEQPENAAQDDNVYNLGGTVNVDVLNELTPGAGITIDGVLLKDGAVTKTGPDMIDANTGITAFATGGQASATALTGQYNNVTTVATAGDSVKLLTAVGGLVQEVKNSGATTLAVFPNTSDSINALAVNLSIDLLPGATKRFIAISDTVFETQEVITVNAPTTQRGSLSFKATDNAANSDIQVTNASMGQDTVVSIPDPGGATGTFALLEGAQTFAAVQTYGAINLGKATDAITAFATGGQGSAVALASTFNSITVCATAGDSVALPVAVAGKEVTVNNLGAKYADVFPFSGDLIDASAIDAAIPLAPGQSITFTCTVALSWKSSPQEKLGVQYTTGTTTTTFAVDQLTGGAYVVYNNTQGTPGSIAVRTAALMIADDPFFRIGGAYRLRIINNQASGTLTVTTAAGVTLTGTMTVAANTFRDFAVTYNTATTMTIQSMGIGTDD